jgi:hypothetical protein
MQFTLPIPTIVEAAQNQPYSFSDFAGRESFPELLGSQLRGLPQVPSLHPLVRNPTTSPSIPAHLDSYFALLKQIRSETAQLQNLKNVPLRFVLQSYL